MMNTKDLAIGAMFAALAAAFQVVPAFFSEAFVFITMLSALPMYVISRKKPSIGLMSFFAATIVILLFSPHEGMFFVFTNGSIGLILGTSTYYFKAKFPVVFACTFVEVILLTILNFGIGVPILGDGVTVAGVSECLLLFVGLFLYIIIYNEFACLVYLRMTKMFN